MKLSYVIRFSLIFTACVAIFSQLTQASTSPPLAPKGFIQLLHVNPYGGKVLRPKGLNLTKPDAAWEKQTGKYFNARLKYEQIYKNYGCYTMKIHKPKPIETRTGGSNFSSYGIPVKRNRNYIVSVLVKTNFPRRNSEINVALRIYDKYGHSLPPTRRLGIPSITQGPNGWQRCIWTITTPNDPRINYAKAWISTIVSPNVAKKYEDFHFSIADFAFVLLPAKPLIPLANGEGVIFPGGPGDLPMSIDGVSKQDGHLIVKTTGAKYDFNTKNDTIIVSQRIGFKRQLAKWHSSISLKDLKIEMQDKDVCVLSNSLLTIGIQCDSLMVINPQAKLQMTLTNLLGGDYNRYARGFLLSEDDFGGFTVDPYIPSGTGLQPQSKLLTNDLSFVKLTSLHKIIEDHKTKNPKHPGIWSTFKPGAEKPGWKAIWATLPGELFCTSVFPPRPYPWKKSFNYGQKATFLYWKNLDKKLNPDFPVSTWILWNFIPRTWGRSYTPFYKPTWTRKLQEFIEKIHATGKYAIPYMSMYWSPTRDPDTYIAAVREWKRRYGIDGIYSDGLPTADWMIKYKEMRMLRELFPSGSLVIHDSIHQDGWALSQFMPYLYTYATAIYLGERMTSNNGDKWIQPRYITSQFRKSNAIGVTKPNSWKDADGNLMKERAALVDLVYNGRDSTGKKEYKKYYTAVKELCNLWKKKGNKPHFYDKYYLPTAQKLTGYKIGRTGMPIANREISGGNKIITLKSLTPDAIIRYTIDGSTVTEHSPKYSSPIKLSKKMTTIKAQAFAKGLGPSALLTVKIN